LRVMDMARPETHSRAPQTLLNGSSFAFSNEKTNENETTSMTTLTPQPNSSSVIHSNNKKSSSTLSTQHVTESRPPSSMPRFLWGIFTMDSPTEQRRREIIRETYLSTYKYKNDSSTANSICSLQDLLHDKVRHPEQCWMVYTFVLGGNPPNGTTELVDNVTSLADMTMSCYSDSVAAKSTTTLEVKEHDDLLFLNIKENMNEGKTPTWFHYASLLLKEHTSLGLEFVSKLDSDTVIFPTRFFDFVHGDKETSHLLLYKKTRIYAGRVYKGKLCGYCDKDLVGTSFMHGGFYFVSMDLASWITSQMTSEKRRAVTLAGEDMSTGNYVYSHPLPIQKLSLGKPHANNLFTHPMKDPGRYQHNWWSRSGFDRKKMQLQHHLSV
jgi:hypothetical protein